MNRYGWFVTTLLVDPSKYLPFLMKKWVSLLLHMTITVVSASWSLSVRAW